MLPPFIFLARSTMVTYPPEAVFSPLYPNGFPAPLSGISLLNQFNHWFITCMCCAKYDLHKMLYKLFKTQWKEKCSVKNVQPTVQRRCGTSRTRLRSRSVLPTWWLNGSSVLVGSTSSSRNCLGAVLVHRIYNGATFERLHLKVTQLHRCWRQTRSLLNILGRLSDDCVLTITIHYCIIEWLSVLKFLFTV